MEGFIDFCQKYPAVVVILGFLVVIFIIAKGRTVVYNGPWETKRGKAYTYTDRATGSTFLSPSRIIGVNMLGSRREKFGKPAWSFSITLLWVAVIGIIICALS